MNEYNNDIIYALLQNINVDLYNIDVQMSNKGIFVLASNLADIKQFRYIILHQN